jgi:hypothetical protein
VRIIGEQARDYDLAELAEAVMAMPPLEGIGGSTSDLDFNDAGRGSIEDIFVQRVREGGADGITRFEAISKVIGYWIRRARDGHFTPAGAWEEIVAYNEARIDPLDRLQAEAERLWKRDRENNGPLHADGGVHDGGDDGVVLPVGFTEDALALEFTSRHGDNWRYVAGWGSGFSGAAPTGRRGRRSGPTILPGSSAATQLAAATTARRRPSCRLRRRCRRWSVSPAPIVVMPPPPRSGIATCGPSTLRAG